jgi:hypothetical protein
MQMLNDVELQQVKEITDEARRGAVNDIQVIIENTISKQLELLAEGQQTLLDTLATKSKVEELEDDILMLKQVIRIMSQDIEQLKKAQ